MRYARGMLLAQAEMVALDFESTGVVGDFPAEPWQLGMIRLRNGRADPEAMFSTFLYVGDRPFSPYAPGRHHALRDELARAPRLPSLWPELRTWWLGHPLAAHNAATEKKFVREAAPLHRTGPWIDTLKLARMAYPASASHTLEDLIEALGLGERVRALCPDGAPHDALYDAVGCAALLEHLLALPGWESVTVEEAARAHPAAFYRRQK